MKKKYTRSVKIVCPNCSHLISHGTLEERFWNGVLKGEGCWEWQGYTNSGGYGATWDKGVSVLAHRASYTFTYGTIPEGMDVCHRCDNPKCVRPDHLFLGTGKDNIRDQIEKGRHPHNETHGMAKLTVEIVKTIRLENTTIGYKTLAKKYGVNPSTIASVVNRTTWKDV